jgi:hypothetical protein
MGDGVKRRINLMAKRLVDLRGNVLDERSPGRHIEHLQAAADSQRRSIFRKRKLGQLELERIAGGFSKMRFWVTGLVIMNGIQIVAARKQEPVEIANRWRLIE